MIKKITSGEELLAIIIPHDHESEGIEFFTPDSFSQQLAYMHHPEGKIIQPHVHNPVKRSVTFTQEVLFIRKGKLRVDFYNNQKKYLQSHILEQGDIILLITGGHGFESLEEIEMIEVKQGPYIGEQDKTRFKGVAPENIHIIK